MAVVWEEKYSTGEEKIDGQHKTLFVYIAKLETLLNSEQIDAAEVGNVIRFLETFARTHFVYEELCMFRHKCPVFEKNQAAHDAFTAVVERLKQRYRVEGATRSVVIEVHDTLTNWLLGHICKIDTQLKACL